MSIIIRHPCILLFLAPKNERKKNKYQHSLRVKSSRTALCARYTQISEWNLHHLTRVLKLSALTPHSLRIAACSSMAKHKLHVPSGLTKETLNLPFYNSDRRVGSSEAMCTVLMYDMHPLRRGIVNLAYVCASLAPWLGQAWCVFPVTTCTL